MIIGALRYLSDSCKNIGFAIEMKNGARYSDCDFKEICTLSNELEFTWTGVLGKITVEWNLVRKGIGAIVKLSISNCSGLGIISMECLAVEFNPKTDPDDGWRILQNSDDHVMNPIGFPLVRDALSDPQPCSLMTGAFSNGLHGIMLATILPQKHKHLYTCFHNDSGSLVFRATTILSKPFMNETKLYSEAVWISVTETAIIAFESMAQQYKGALPVNQVYGWSSWDYYFSTVSLYDIEENMQAITCDHILKEHLTHIVIDDGWAYRWGEWESNHKFPGGLLAAARLISSYGFIPGIWTAPICVEPQSLAALRMPEILIKDDYGDPLEVSGRFLVDPTSPAGISYLAGIYNRLYRDGFRFYKVDYVSELLQVDYFHDRLSSPYDAIRKIFSIIRACVGSESHILGCSLPAECGPGVADSHRTGIDIHNHWNHICWAIECYTFKYWMNGRFWINDADFLVVRGSDTSLEAETNVTNPNKNKPSKQGFMMRWRQGPVFTEDEATTWANFLYMTGGNLFCSDMIAKLNERGISLLHRVFEKPGRSTALPLDLCEGYHASIWYRKNGDVHELLLINWDPKESLISLDFNRFALDSPEGILALNPNEKIPVIDGRLAMLLRAHASRIVVWRNNGID